MSKHKNQQKMIKNQENRKTGKSEKSKKCKKWQNQKIKNHQNQKIRKVKNTKKGQKMTPPPKWPKCQINDQKWHFVKSEPPGPAFFRFQGVPRDPVLRPDLDPPYFSCFLTHFMHFSDFDFVRFTVFWVLVKLINCTFLWKWHFLTLLPFV